MKAYELFCLRGCEPGSDVEDWLKAERELSLGADEVTIENSEAGLDVSIAGERAQEGHIFLSIAPSSLLILWTGAETDSTRREVDAHRSTLSLLSLPASADPARAEVTYKEDRVWLHLPYICVAESPETSATNTDATDAG